MHTIEIKEAIDPTIPARFIVERSVRETQGGEGEVCMSPDGRWAVKIFKHPTPSREDWLRSVMEMFRVLSDEQKEFFVPPLALVAKVDGAHRIGFVMRQLPKPAFQELRRLIDSPYHAGKQFAEGKSWRDWLVLARNVANSVVVLHRRGCAHSDIHFRNFMADINTGAAVMLEADGVVVRGFRKAEVKGLRGFVAPEVITDGVIPHEMTDRHSLAVLVLQTLLYRNVMEPRKDYHPNVAMSEKLGWGREAVFSEHPDDRRNFVAEIGQPLYKRGQLSYRMLTPKLRALTERALIDALFEPEARPQPQAWLRALSCALDEVQPCDYEDCGQSYPYPHWAPQPEKVPCPFCGRTRFAPPPLVLFLYQETLRGEFDPEEWNLVVSHGQSLYEDATNRDVLLPQLKGRRAIGYAELDRTAGRYVLVNDSDTPWFVWSFIDGRRKTIGRGQSLVVESELCIRFGTSGRLARVTSALERWPGNPPALPAGERETLSPGAAPS